MEIFKHPGKNLNGLGIFHCLFKAKLSYFIMLFHVKSTKRDCMLIEIKIRVKVLFAYKKPHESNIASIRLKFFELIYQCEGQGVNLKTYTKPS